MALQSHRRGFLTGADPDKEFTEMVLFLMVICHQPYHEIMEMPVATSARLIQSFGTWIDKLFKKSPSAENLIANIDYEAILNKQQQ